MTLRTEIVGTTARLAEIGPAWDALWRRCGRSAFQSHGWISAWWTTRPALDASRLCVALCWAGDGLAAAMPLATRRHRGVRVLEWAAKDCSDYCDALADLGSPDGRAALQQAWAAVAASARFDLAYLSNLRPDAAFRALLDGRQPVRLRPGQRTARSLQVHGGAAGGQAWLRRLDEGTRGSHALRLRTLGEAGPVVGRAWGPGEPTDALLERMVALKQQWLARTGQSGGIMEDDAATLRALARELVRQGTFRLFTIHCGDRLAAGLLAIADGTREQVFLSAHDPQFDRAEPEALVLVEYMVSAFDKGLTEVDLLRVEDDGSYGFADARLDLASCVGSRTLVGRLALTVGERLDRSRAAGVSTPDVAAP